MMKVDTALHLLLSSGKKSLTIKEAVELIELVTKDPELIREVLKKGVEQGSLERKETNVAISTGDTVFTKPRIRRFDCDSSCRRCGVKIKNCHYIIIEDEELGPFGSECVRKVL
jgi:hypothetical protein